MGVYHHTAAGHWNAITLLRAPGTRSHCCGPVERDHTAAGHWNAITLLRATGTRSHCCGPVERDYTDHTAAGHWNAITLLRATGTRSHCCGSLERDQTAAVHWNASLELPDTLHSAHQGHVSIVQREAVTAYFSTLWTLNI